MTTTNLERNLFLTTQLIDMDIKVVIALNMYDEMERTGARLDYEPPWAACWAFRSFRRSLRREPASAGCSNTRVAKVFDDKKSRPVRHIHINYGTGTSKTRLRHPPQ